MNCRLALRRQVDWSMANCGDDSWPSGKSTSMPKFDECRNPQMKMSVDEVKSN